MLERLIVHIRCVILELHIVVRMQLLHIDCVHHFLTSYGAGLVELLATTKLFDDTGLVEFAFEFLNGAFDILAFFYGYYDHCMTPPLALRFAVV